MTTPLPNARFEHKFIAERHSLSDVLSLVRRHPAAFRETFKERVVNNVYLDTPGLHDFQDHVNGIARRGKKRVRWYGPATSLVENPALELKLREGRVTGKITHRLPAFTLNTIGVNQQLGHSFDSANLPEFLRAALRLREPSLFNRYRRHYFVSGDGRFRLTVDSELRFGQVGKAALPDSSLSPSSAFLVVELKFLPEHALQAAAVTNNLPFRLTRCSKYVLGVQRIRL